MKTWGLRAAGWVLMFLSIQLTMRIIYTLGKYWSSQTEVIPISAFSLRLSAPFLQWTGFLFSESWCLWGWRSSPCACLARCLSSPLLQAGFFIVHWWLRLWQRSLWSRCSWPAPEFQLRRTSDVLKEKRVSGACEPKCWRVLCVSTCSSYFIKSLLRGWLVFQCSPTACLSGPSEMPEGKLLFWSGTMNVFFFFLLPALYLDITFF